MNIGDTTSIYKVANGGQGDPGIDASIAFLTNENITFAGNASEEGAMLFAKLSPILATLQ